MVIRKVTTGFIGSINSVGHYFTSIKREIIISVKFNKAFFYALTVFIIVKFSVLFYYSLKHLSVCAKFIGAVRKITTGFIGLVNFVNHYFAFIKCEVIVTVHLNKAFFYAFAVLIVIEFSVFLYNRTFGRRA